MDTDTPHDQEDPHSQADEGHLQDGAGGQGPGTVQDDRPAHVAVASHSHRFAPLWARDYLRPDLDFIYYTIIL